MKFQSIFMTLAAGLALASCGSDEPGYNNPGNSEEGSTMYLSINIADANSGRSRTDYYDEKGNKVETPTEGDYAFGESKENYINRVDFIFFDEAGNFAARTNIWSGATETTNAPNIELIGNHNLTVRNLSEDNLPTWVITVVNAPADWAESVETRNLNMKEVAKERFEILTGENFVMATTSFFDGEADRYDNTHFYATKLKKDDWMKEAPTSTEAIEKSVSIYVERLAAKFQLTGLDSKNAIPVQVTIAGFENGDDNTTVGGTVNSASTTVYVKILGYGLTGVEEKSYLSKDIEGLNTVNPWDNWNNAGFHRSFWGMSPNYNNADGLIYSSFAAANNDPSKAIYGKETTKSLDLIKTSATDNDNTLKTSQVTNLLITARVYKDAAFKEPLDLVEFDGMYFEKKQYAKYMLGRLLAAGGLQYWKNETEDGTKETTTTVENEDGSTTTTTQTVTAYKYDALALEDFNIDWTSAGMGTGTVVFTFKPEAGTKIYKKGEGYTDGDRLVEATADDVNAELKSFNSGNHAVAFNGGSMYYNVPVEHLKGENLSTDYVAKTLGSYGTVRNHWYQINVNKLISLGQGVFKPGDLTGEDGKVDTETEPIIPDDPKKDRYALATQIRILSWKIVSQSVDL
ncbi:MAG: fimbria major subunit [Lachnoclostridium sp.]|nr:fimbria major subunit [Lachnoclostridium sp.]